MAWNEYRLSEIVNLIGGGTPNTRNPEYWGGSIPWLSVADFNAGYRRVYTSEKTITEKALQESSTTLLKKGQLIISARGTVGVVAQLGRDMAFNQSCYGIDAKPDKAFNDFLYYLLRYTVSNIRRITHGAVFDTITRESFAHILIRLPPLNEQKTIASILGSLDDKIELNRRMNETLEAMARAIFKSWFVDFDPIPGYGPHKEWHDSPVGRIPKGWEIATLGDYSSLNPEVWSKETRPDVINYVDLSNTKWGRIEAITIYAKEEAPSRAQRVLRVHDTILGTVRPGNGSYTFILEDGLTGSTGFAVLRPLRSEYAEIVYLAATAADNIERLAHLADGAAYPAVRPEVVVATQIVKPNDKILRAFSHILAPLCVKMSANERESRTLATIRDALLPKLLSGKIGVKDAEKFVEGME